MQLSDKVAVVTGGASGIGRALCLRFAQEGARAVVVADQNEAGAEAVAAEVAGAGSRSAAVRVDVAAEAEVSALVQRTENEFGPIDLFCSNAGIGGGGGIEAPTAEWQQVWDVNVMAHVFAARAVVPFMVARGEGYLLHTASAAGLLAQIGNAPYSVTKHAVVALAEWLSITYGDTGVRVSCLCPQGVRTPMLLGGLEQVDAGASAVLAAGGMLEPEQVADAVVAGLADERFLILPHPEVAEYLRRKATDPDRWLRGMRRLHARVTQPHAGG